MRLLIPVLLILLSSCASQKISIFVEVYQPYCGGAKPTPEMARGVRTAYSNEKVAIYRSSSDKSQSQVFVKWILLDSTGKWKGQLKQGNYIVFRSDKILSIEEIQQKYRKPDNEMYAFVGLEYLESWKKTPDFTFEVKDKTNISITLTEKCFVGLNPCMEYIGPKPK
ncbi:MAG: hypothetical protein ACOVNZ_00290 [Crocinitomicaceae bacterium]